MSFKVKVIVSALITMLLQKPVKNFAIAHHTQFNTGVVVLLFVIILAAILCVEFFGEFWMTCDAMAEEDENDV